MVIFQRPRLPSVRWGEEEEVRRVVLQFAAHLGGQEGLAQRQRGVRQVPPVPVQEEERPEGGQGAGGEAQQTTQQRTLGQLCQVAILCLS